MLLQNTGNYLPGNMVYTSQKTCIFQGLHLQILVTITSTLQNEPHFIHKEKYLKISLFPLVENESDQHC